MPHTSIIPPNVTPPDPLVVKMVAIVFSLCMSFVLIMFIGFVGIEFLSEMLGHPLKFETQSPVYEVPLPSEQETITVFKSPFELITPKHQTQMSGPEVVVIYTCRLSDSPTTLPPDLWVDGTWHPWETQFGNNTWFARLQLLEGLHRVRVDESESEFFVGTTDSPRLSSAEWTWNRPHPDTDNIYRCYDCHEPGKYALTALSTQRPAIGAWKGDSSCFACHEMAEYEFRHAVIGTTTNQCFRCHSMH